MVVTLFRRSFSRIRRELRDEGIALESNRPYSIIGVMLAHFKVF